MGIHTGKHTGKTHRENTQGKHTGKTHRENTQGKHTGKTHRENTQGKHTGKTHRETHTGKTHRKNTQGKHTGKIQGKHRENTGKTQGKKFQLCMNHLYKCIFFFIFIILSSFFSFQIIWKTYLKIIQIIKTFLVRLYFVLLFFLYHTHNALYLSCIIPIMHCILPFV